MKNFIYNHSGGFTALPLYLAVNIINKCNRTCNFCPYHSPHCKPDDAYTWFRNQPDYLPLQHYIQFLERLGPFRHMIKHIALTGKGEPTMHPMFTDFCIVTNNSGIPFTITTNGDLLKPFIYKGILKLSGLKGIRVSAYDIKTAKYWHEISKANPKISVFNQTGTPIKGIETGYTAIQNPGIADYCDMPKDFNKITSCKAPFVHLTINTDGSVVPCYSYNKVGTIYDPFWKIWNGKEVRKYRRDALKMQCERSDCLNCGIQIGKFK